MSINYKQEQENKLNDIKESLAARKISLVVVFDPNLHDRQIRLSNGWIIQLGRGLSYFKPPGKSLKYCFELTQLSVYTYNFSNVVIIEI